MIDNSTGKITFEHKATSPSETIFGNADSPDASTMASKITLDKAGNMTVLMTSNEASRLLDKTGLNISYDLTFYIPKNKSKPVTTTMNQDGFPGYEVTVNQKKGLVFGYGFNPREAGETLLSLLGWKSGRISLLLNKRENKERI